MGMKITWSSPLWQSASSSSPTLSGPTWMDWIGVAEVLWGMRGLQPDSIALHLYTDPLLLLHCITWQISAPPYNVYIAAFKIKTSSAMIHKTQVHRHCNAQLALLQGVHRCPGAAMHPAGISSLLNVTSHLVSPVGRNITPTSHSHWKTLNFFCQ